MTRIDGWDWSLEKRMAMLIMGSYFETMLRFLPKTAAHSHVRYLEILIILFIVELSLAVSISAANRLKSTKAIQKSPKTQVSKS